MSERVSDWKNGERNGELSDFPESPKKSDREIAHHWGRNFEACRGGIFFTSLFELLLTEQQLMLKT